MEHLLKLGSIDQSPNYKGGPAALKGFIYQNLFGVSCLIYMVKHQFIRSIRFESVDLSTTTSESDTESKSVDDIIIYTVYGNHQFNLKANTILNSWSFNSLKNAGVWDQFIASFNNDPNVKLYFISMKEINSNLSETIARLKTSRNFEEGSRSIASKKLSQELDNLKGLNLGERLFDFVKQLTFERFTSWQAENIIEATLERYTRDVEKSSIYLSKLVQNLSIEKGKISRDELLEKLREKRLLKESGFDETRMLDLMRQVSTSIITISESPGLELIQYEQVDDIIKTANSYKTENIINNENNEKALLYIIEGEAGYGKSVLVKKLYSKILEMGEAVVGLRADLVSGDTKAQLKNNISNHGLKTDIYTAFLDAINYKGKAFLIIDQLDSLSLSITTNRSKFNAYIELIAELSYIPCLHIIISSRTYDLINDLQLSNLGSRSKRYKLTLIDQEIVSRILQSFIDVELSSNLIELLRLPINLVLFMKIKDNTLNYDELTTQSVLYSHLIKIKTSNHQDPVRCNDFLHSIAEQMATAQVLSFRKNLFLQDPDIVTYLIHEGLLKQESGNLSFYHQTLFEYLSILAIEKSQRLEIYFLNSKQGLLDGALLKRALVYLQDINYDRYISLLSTLLISEDITNSYRFHLRLVAIRHLATKSLVSDLESDLILSIFKFEQTNLILIECFCEVNLSESWLKIFLTSSIIKDKVSSVISFEQLPEWLRMIVRQIARKLPQNLYSIYQPLMLPTNSDKWILELIYPTCITTAPILNFILSNIGHYIQDDRSHIYHIIAEIADTNNQWSLKALSQIPPQKYAGNFFTGTDSYYFALALKSSLKNSTTLTCSFSLNKYQEIINYYFTQTYRNESTEEVLTSSLFIFEHDEFNLEEETNVLSLIRHYAERALIDYVLNDNPQSMHILNSWLFSKYDALILSGLKVVYSLDGAFDSHAINVIHQRNLWHYYKSQSRPYLKLILQRVYINADINERESLEQVIISIKDKFSVSKYKSLRQDIPIAERTGIYGYTAWHYISVLVGYRILWSDKFRVYAEMIERNFISPIPIKESQYIKILPGNKSPYPDDVVNKWSLKHWLSAIKLHHSNTLRIDHSGSNGLSAHLNRVATTNPQLVCQVIESLIMITDTSFNEVYILEALEGISTIDEFQSSFDKYLIVLMGRWKLNMKQSYLNLLYKRGKLNEPIMDLLLEIALYYRDVEDPELGSDQLNKCLNQISGKSIDLIARQPCSPKRNTCLWRIVEDLSIDTTSKLSNKLMAANYIHYLLENNEAKDNHLVELYLSLIENNPINASFVSEPIMDLAVVAPNKFLTLFSDGIDLPDCHNVITLKLVNLILWNKSEFKVVFYKYIKLEQCAIEAVEHFTRTYASFIDSQFEALECIFRICRIYPNAINYFGNNLDMNHSEYFIDLLPLIELYAGTSTKPSESFYKILKLNVQHYSDTVLNLMCTSINLLEDEAYTYISNHSAYEVIYDLYSYYLKTNDQNRIDKCLDMIDAYLQHPSFRYVTIRNNKLDIENPSNR